MKVRLVTETFGVDTTDMSFDDACRAALERALKLGITALVILGDLPNEFHIDSVPKSRSLERGAARTAYETYVPVFDAE